MALSGGERRRELPRQPRRLPHQPRRLPLDELRSRGFVGSEDTEDIEILKLSLDDAIAMIDRGEITDAISVAALLRVARLRAASSP